MTFHVNKPGDSALARGSNRYDPAAIKRGVHASFRGAAIAACQTPSEAGIKKAPAALFYGEHRI
jgi:hypothetical protein